MAKSQVFANTDLVRKIYSFGEPAHRKFTKNLKLDLSPWPEVFMMKYMDRQLASNIYGYPIQEYLHEYSIERIVSMLHSYKRCFCCQRHNTDKPILVDKKVIFPKTMVYENNSSECYCRCRKLSRIFIKHLMVYS